MNKTIYNLFIVGLFLVLILLSSGFQTSNESSTDLKKSLIHDPDTELKREVLEILQTKCNVCHKKQNPFKVFSLKNMERQAPRIYKQVFIYQRMPKGNEIQLTEAEYQTLKNWLKSQNIQ